MTLRRNRTFALSAVIVLVAGAACGGDQPMNNPPPPPVVGSARVTWKIQTPAGDAVDCADLGIEDALVSMAGREAVVPCGQEQVAVFDNLIAQRYPVVVKLRILGGSGVRLEAASNVVVEGGKQADVDVTLTYDPIVGDRGRLLIRWRIDNEPAATGCTRAGGATVVVQELPGSRSELDNQAPCTDGQLQFDDIPAGSYGVLVTLRDASGATITSNAISSVDVRPGDVTMPPELSLFTDAADRSRMFARWTINGTDPATGCGMVNADDVILRAFPESEFVATFTATVACTAGQVNVEDIPPGIREHRVSFQLVGDLTGVLTSTTVYDVLFLRGQTATVAVDLRTN
jgi:hypothetical protein